MATKTYWLKFGPDDPRRFTGLAPTFLVFQTESGGTLAPPGITERITGASGTGFYQFGHSSALSIAFLVDGGATLATSSRYISGSLDPVQAVDTQISQFNTDLGSTLSGMGATLVGIGSSLSGFNTALGTTLSILGSTASIYGGSALDPSTIMGYTKRLQEFLEGNASFNKSTGVWTIQSRSGATTLATKTLTNTSSQATKT